MSDEDSDVVSAGSVGDTVESMIESDWPVRITIEPQQYAPGSLSSERYVVHTTELELVDGVYQRADRRQHLERVVAEFDTIAEEAELDSHEQIKVTVSMGTDHRLPDDVRDLLESDDRLRVVDMSFVVGPDDEIVARLTVRVSEAVL